MENFVQAIIQQLPANKDRLEQYRKAQQDDSLCSQVIGYTKSSGQQDTQLKESSRSTGP